MEGNYEGCSFTRFYVFLFIPIENSDYIWVNQDAYRFWVKLKYLVFASSPSNVYLYPTPPPLQLEVFA